MLLIGTASGLGPLLGIARDVLAQGHAGASLGDIHADPFELRELRRGPR